jgi:hypothetical protein
VPSVLVRWLTTLAATAISLWAFPPGNAVGHNMKGEPESVRYEQINAMLLNEFLKEHRKNEAQNSKIESQAGKIQE